MILIRFPNKFNKYKHIFMNAGESNKLDRIEEKFDKMAEAVIAAHN